MRKNVVMRVALATLAAFATSALGIGTVALHAQGATGKMEGRVRDASGAPIANAQVYVVGTAFNGQTNAQGYFFINNVPAGTVTVRAAFVGYRPISVQGVRVLAGQTITQDFTLEQAPAVIADLVIEAPPQPLVPRDEVATKQRISGDMADKLPVDRIDQVLALQPGVVANSNSTQLSIRGGRVDEAVTYVDGVPISPGYRGNNIVAPGVNAAGVNVQPLQVGTNAVEEASVTTGSSSAEYGNAQSGVISMQTRSGGSAFSGSFGLESDEPFGKATSLGYNRVQAAFGGPLASNLTFFVSGVLQGQKSQPSGMESRNAPVFVPAGTERMIAVPSAVDTMPVPTADTTLVEIRNFAIARGNCDEFSGSTNADIAGNYGLDCQGVRTPGTAASQYQLQGKLAYSYGTGSRLALSYNGSQNQGRNFSQFNQFNPQALNGFRLWSNVFTLNWTQNLTRSRERALALETYVSYQQDRTIGSPMTPETELDTRDPFGGFMIAPMDFLFDFDNFPIDEELVNNIRTNSGRRSPYDLDKANDYAVRAIYGRTNPYGLVGADAAIFGTPLNFYEEGGPGGAVGNRLTLYRENRWIGKANLDWQADRYNRLRLGGEFTRYDIASYTHNLTSQAFFDVFMEKPIRWDAFIEDRLDLGDVVVVGGLRYDFYDSRASRPVTADSGNFYPRISSAPGFNPDDPTALFKQDESHSYLSPHVQVSFPVTDRTNFRLSYAHQVQVPDFALVYGGINTDVALSNTNNPYGADLDFGKTVTFEFGVRHSFSEDMVLDLAVYNKDNLANAAFRLVPLYDPIRRVRNDIRLVTNADFGNTRGIDVRLDRRIGNFFNGTVAYTYQQAKNTGSNPFEYINFGSRLLNGLGGGNQPPPQAILPTRQSRPHNLAGAVSFTFPADWKEGSAIGAIFSNFGTYATFRYASGTAYTRCATGTSSEEILSGGVCNGNEIEGTPNGARLPSFKQLDMRFTKGFGLGGLDMTAYLDARNILNLTNVLAVFTVTSDTKDAQDSTRFAAGELREMGAEAGANNSIYGMDIFRAADSTVDLSFGGAADPAGQCTNWVKADGSSAAPNCVYLLRAEERFGNGDHVYTKEEQLRAINAFYQSVRGIQTLTGNPRELRLGVEVNF